MLFKIENYFSFHFDLKKSNVLCGGLINTIEKIRKRDGSIVPFDQSKITEAIWKAVQAVGGKDKTKAEQLSNEVVKLLEKGF